MSRAIADLRQEHSTILSSLAILDGFCNDIGEGRIPPAEDLRTLTAFLGDFADGVHHGKEERILFPSLDTAGIGQGESSVQALAAEHALARDLTRQMRLALSSGPDHLTFAHAARSFSSLLRAHIRKEDERLFPAAESALDPVQWSRLDRSFEEYERSLPDQPQEVRQRIRDLAARYQR